MADPVDHWDGQPAIPIYLNGSVLEQEVGRSLSLGRVGEMADKSA